LSKYKITQRYRFTTTMESSDRQVKEHIKMFDIAANLSDDTFNGVYYGKST